MRGGRREKIESKGNNRRGRRAGGLGRRKDRKHPGNDIDFAYWLPLFCVTCRSCFHPPFDRQTCLWRRNGKCLNEERRAATRNPRMFEIQSYQSMFISTASEMKMHKMYTETFENIYTTIICPIYYYKYTIKPTHQSITSSSGPPPSTPRCPRT